jgi:hypothetical protein
VFARELGRDHPRYITLLNAAIALEMSAYAHPADAQDRGDASADTKRLDALERLVLADAASTGVGAVTIVRMPDDEHRDGHRITASWTVGMDAPPATTIRAAIDHAMHAGAEPETVELPCGVLMGDAEDLLAEHLAGCGRCADAVTEGDDA